MANHLPTPEEVNLFVGAAHGDLATVRAFADAFPEHINAPSGQGETALQAAAHTGQRAIAEFLLARGAPLDICTAAVLGRDQTVREMLAADRSLAKATGAHGIPVAFYSALAGNLVAAAVLHEYGADLNGGAKVNTPLHGAVLGGHPEMAQWLLEHGATPNLPDYAGKTPLQLAEQYGRTAVAEVLRGVADPV